MKDPDGEIRTKLAIQRNSLANERTFLAWLRSGLAGVVAGFALIRFVDFKTQAHQRISYLIGLFLVIWGISLIIFATFEFRKIHYQLKTLDPNLITTTLPKTIFAVALIGLSLLIFILLL